MDYGKVTHLSFGDPYQVGLLPHFFQIFHYFFYKFKKKNAEFRKPRFAGFIVYSLLQKSMNQTTHLTSALEDSHHPSHFLIILYPKASYGRPKACYGGRQTTAFQNNPAKSQGDYY